MTATMYDDGPDQIELPYSFYAWGKPKVKGRPRLTRRGKAYTPQSTHDAERILRDQYEGPCFTGLVSVEISLQQQGTAITVAPLDYSPTARIGQGDVDNFAKLVLDGLNGVAYEDDKQVRSLYVYVE